MINKISKIFYEIIAYRAGFLTEEFHWDTKEWKSIEWGSVFDEIVWGN